MSRYGTPFCSDEELLEELGKLGYDDVSEDVFGMMKDDLSELVEKDQNDLPLSDYDSYNSPLSSKFLSSSDALIEYTTNEISKKSDPSVSRKVKKKFTNTSSKTANEFNADKEASETSRRKSNRKSKIKSSTLSFDYENKYNDENLSDLEVPEDKYTSVSDKSNRKSKIKSSSLSFDYENKYNDENLSDLEVPEDKYTSVSGTKSVDNYSKLYDVDSDINRNEDIGYNDDIQYDTKGFLSKEDDYQSNYSSKHDRLSLKSDSSSKFRSNATKDTKFTSAYGKSYDQAYSLSGIRKTDNLQKGVKDAFKTYKLEKNFSESDEHLLYNYKGSDLNLNTSQSSISSETKTIKRKVLRRRNGRSVITEEIVQIPSVFDSSYPDSESFNNSKSFSSDDLSCKSNGSTGSIAAVSPESSIKSSPSTFSLLSTRSTSLRVPNSRKKKSDPVAMYGYYRKYWDNFKPPGENTHDRLRWAVRDKMLEYNI